MLFFFTKYVFLNNNKHLEYKTNIDFRVIVLVYKFVVNFNLIHFYSFIKQYILKSIGPAFLFLIKYGWTVSATISLFHLRWRQVGEDLIEKFFFCSSSLSFMLIMAIFLIKNVLVVTLVKIWLAKF